MHVVDIDRYCTFLVNLFGGGRYRRISESGTHMYKSPSGLCIEVKRDHASSLEEKRQTLGFALPCIRFAGAKKWIEGSLGLKITRTISNPSGEVHFFKDHEGIEWHWKDYDTPDEYVNW